LAKRNLLHLANFHSTNIGNGALISGAETVLSEDLSESISWTPVAWDDYTFGLKPFDKKFVDLINASDGMIVNGAVTLNGREYLKNAGMRFDLPLNLWENIKKPVVFYGISYRHWQGQPYHNLEQLKSAVNFILNSDLMILGVRNDGTKAWLENLTGISSSKIIEIPDTGMFVKADSKGVWHQISEEFPNVILAFNNEDSESRFNKNSPNEIPGQVDAEKRRHLLKQIAIAVEQLDSEQKVRFLAVPHYYDDFEMIGEFIKICRPQLAHQNMVSTGLLPVSGTGYFYGMYANADLAVSMRVHSISPSIGLGVPMIPLITQDRIKTYLSNADLNDIGIDVFSETDFAEHLYQKMISALKNPDKLKNRFKKAREQFRSDIQSINRRIEELLNF